MNFPFIVVVVAAISGLSSELALRNIAPDAGPIFALVLMAAAVLLGARLLGRTVVVAKPVTPRTATNPALRSAGESLNPA